MSIRQAEILLSWMVLLSCHCSLLELGSGFRLCFGKFRQTFLNTADGPDDFADVVSRGMTHSTASIVNLPCVWEHYYSTIRSLC